MRTNFIGGLANVTDGALSAQECENFIVEADNDKSPISLRPTPAIRKMTLDAGVVLNRVYEIAKITTSGSAISFVIVGNDGTNDCIYECRIDFNAKIEKLAKATFATSFSDNSFVKVAYNGSDVGIVDNSGQVYSWDLTDGASLTDVGAAVNDIVSLDGFYFYRRNVVDEYNQIIASNFEDGSTISTLNFGKPAGQSGNVIALHSDQRELIVFCNNAIEFWYNAGNANFPLLRNQSVYLEVGMQLDDKRSVTSLHGVVYFCGAPHRGQRGIYALNGYSLSKISTHYIDEYLKNKNVDATCYSSNGHDFLLVHVWQFDNPLDESAGTENNRKCFCYDITYGIWTTRKTNQDYRSELDYHVYKAINVGMLGNYGTYNLCINKKSLYLTDPNIYHIDDDLYQDNIYDGSTTTTYIVERFRITPHIYGPDNREMVHSVLELEFKPVDAKVYLTWSDDDGATWANGRLILLTTRSGRAREEGLGSSRDRIYKLTVDSNANTEVILMNAWLNGKPA